MILLHFKDAQARDQNEKNVLSVSSFGMLAWQADFKRMKRSVK